jgi:DNA processing protein
MLGVQSLGPLVPRRVAEGRGVAAAATRQPAAGPTTVPPHDAAERERWAWVTVLSVPGLGPVSFGALLAAFGSAGAVLHAATQPDGPGRLLEALADATSDADAGSDPGLFDTCAVEEAAAGAVGRPGRQIIGRELAVRLCEAAIDGGAADRVRALGLAVVTLEDAEYPDRLRRVELPPPLLFVRGAIAALSARHAVAVVGTRWPTDKGRLIAGWIGSALARTGAVVVSGLAVGIDGAAHAAVVAEGGRTVAVLGGGHARLFPKAHERLAEAIVESGGTVVSELAPETSPSRGTFPRRNRLVSGLSEATVVVEAGKRSGALITAGWALEQGRECFLVPGAFDAPTSAGCHGFLRSFPGQARVVCGIPELIEDLGLEAGPDGHSAPPLRPSASVPAAGRAALLASLGPVERTLAEELGRGPATADQLAERAGLSGAAVLSALTLLELRGLARGSYGRYSPSGPLASWQGRSHH